MARDPIADLVHRYADAVVHHDGDRWGSTWAPDPATILQAEMIAGARLGLQNAEEAGHMRAFRLAAATREATA